MSLVNKPYFVALNRIPKVGPRSVMKLLSRWPNLEELFSLSSQEMMQAGLPEVLAIAIATFNFSQVEVDLRWQEAPQHFLLTWCDPEYPALLKEIYDPPPVLYARGDLSSFQQPTIAMVGTRKPSVSGSETARRFAAELAAKKITIVSGLALGIDAQAHQGCLDAHGKTIAVMGSGIDYIYPRRNTPLSELICKSGLLLSELPLKSAPNAGHFPRRNRIISGLSMCTLVVEAAVRSGSLITARLAMEQNRDVLAIPSSIYNAQASGCHYLLQQGAKLVTSSQDVLEELGIGYHQDTAVLSPSLAKENKNLVKCIGFEVTTVDQIIIRSGLTVERVACDLAELEIQGIIKTVPGGYMRCAI